MVLKDKDQPKFSSNGRLPVTLAPRVGFLLNRCSAHIRELTKQALKPLGIVPRHYGIIATLHSEGPLPQQSIGEKIEIDRASMVLLVDDLEKKRLVVRSTHPQDRRYYLIHLTPAGKKLFEKMVKLVEHVEEEFLTALTPSEKDVLGRILIKLIKKAPAHAQPSVNSRAHRARI